MSDLYECAECGHLHFVNSVVGYVACPICDCQGQDDSPLKVAAIRALFPNVPALADVAEKLRAGGLTRFAR